MSGSDIARELGITRQGVSQTLKSGMRKLYKEIIRTKIAESPFDAICAMMCCFGLHRAQHDDIVDFLYLLPNDVRRELQNDTKYRKL
jgi:hypothetical protein